MRMSWYAVRCCCTPRKIFGFVRLSEEAAQRGVVFLPVREAWGPAALAHVSPDPQHETQMLESVEVHVKTIDDVGSLRWEHAIYSDDRPIEFWRKVVGFVEVRNDKDH